MTDLKEEVRLNRKADEANANGNWLYTLAGNLDPKSVFLFVSSLIGLSSVYSYSYIRNIPQGLRNYLDLDFISYLYVDFFIATAVSGLVARVTVPLLSFLIKLTRFLLTWILSFKSLSNRPMWRRKGRFYISILSKKIRQHSFSVSSIAFVFSLLITLLPFMLGLKLMFLWTALSMLTFCFVYVSVFRVSQRILINPADYFPFPVGTSRKRRASVALTVAAISLSLAAFILGDARFELGKDQTSEIVLAEGRIVIGSVVATGGSGILLVLSSSDSNEESLFVPFSSILSITILRRQANPVLSP